MQWEASRERLQSAILKELSGSMSTQNISSFNATDNSTFNATDSSFNVASALINLVDTPVPANTRILL